MSPFLLRAALAAMTFPALALAKDSISRTDVMAAIRVFDANACGNLATPKPSAAANDAVAQASNSILRFALESDDVMVDLGTDAVPWCDLKKGVADLPHSGERGLLLAAYLAGSVDAQLKSGTPNANPYAGWVHLIPVYRAMKARQGVEIPEIERLLALQASGGLSAYAALTEQKSVERLKQLYGGNGQVPARAKPAPALASASSQ